MIIATDRTALVSQLLQAGFRKCNECRQIKKIRAKSLCDACHGRLMRRLNPDAYRAADRRNHANHREAHLVRLRKYYAEHRAEAIAYVTKWKEEHPERAEANQKRFLEANRDRMKEYHKQYHKEWYASRNQTPEGHAYYLDMNHRRRAVSGTFTLDDLVAIFASQGGTCAICEIDFDLENVPFEVDHIIPINKCGENWPYNIQLLCMPCNRRKRDTMPYMG